MRVGIDLGTTNSAVAVADDEGVHDFPVAQLVAPGETALRAVLPSFLYLPAGPELPAGSLALPWDATREYVVGELARSQGAAVPGRLVASAKSWLCHAGVDREAQILPWSAVGDMPRVSPVEASARYLLHLREAWDAAHAEKLASLEVVLTVPASFDEVARELTVEAAQKAGLGKLTLLEEPQAAFYAWLAAAREIPPDGLILVCDVGGGTTDLTLIKSELGALDRVAVGDHLLLGGDNMDLALARRVEQRLGGKLDARQLAQLVHQCRLAKETLLTPNGPEMQTVTVAGRGAKLIGGAISSELTRAETLETVVEGFFPRVPRDAEVQRGRSALLEFGLPYASDPAVTRHLAEFLRRHGGAMPDAVLFNGGALKARPVCERILDVLADWRGGARPAELRYDRDDRSESRSGGEPASPGAAASPINSLDLAVARGAAYYGLVRLGRGVRVGGGAARAYYVETEVGAGGRAAVCLVPRGAEEGSTTRLPQTFMLLVNRPARFRLFTSTQRSDATGDIVAIDGLGELPPIFAALRLEGTSKDAQLPVELHAHLTEIGTLGIECVVPESGRRWKLAFDLRTADAAAAVAEATPAPPADYSAAVSIVERCFKPPSDIQPDRIIKELEAAIGAPRDDWPLPALRAIWEPLRDLRGDRGRTSAHEARWLNLAGFCLRPGFGYALDDWRMKELWRVWNAGMVNDSNEAVRLSWWILWRRVSGGLGNTQQAEIAKRITPLFLAAPGTRPGGRRPPGPQESGEMWRTVASLERLPPQTKQQLGDVLIDRLDKVGVAGWFSLGRLGARVPLYGPASGVVPKRMAEKWLERLLALDWSKHPEHAAFAAAEIARCAGDRVRDLDDALRARVSERVRIAPDGERLAEMVRSPVVLEAKEERFAFGDALPVGLRLADLPSE